MTAAQDLFWLAHYTYNTLNPLVEEAKAIEPSTQLGIDIVFGNEDSVFTKTHRIVADIHWSLDGMVGRSYQLHNKTDVDAFAETLRGKIDKLILEAAVKEERRGSKPSLIHNYSSF